MLIYHYIPVKENLYSPDIGHYVSFGIRALQLAGERQWREATFCLQMSPLKTRLLYPTLIRICIKRLLGPIHLLDFIQDSI